MWLACWMADVVLVDTAEDIELDDEAGEDAAVPLPLPLREWNEADMDMLPFAGCVVVGGGLEELPEEEREGWEPEGEGGGRGTVRRVSTKPWTRRSRLT